MRQDVAALEHGASASYVDENLDLARADPAMMLLGDRPHIIDEWQRVPQIWDYVRHEVDRTRGTRGAYILTGSATPAFGSKAEAPRIVEPAASAASACTP